MKDVIDESVCIHMLVMLRALVILSLADFKLFREPNQSPGQGFWVKPGMFYVLSHWLCIHLIFLCLLCISKAVKNALSKHRDRTVLWAWKTCSAQNQYSQQLTVSINGVMIFVYLSIYLFN